MDEKSRINSSAWYEDWKSPQGPVVAGPNTWNTTLRLSRLSVRSHGAAEKIRKHLKNIFRARHISWNRSNIVKYNPDQLFRIGFLHLFAGTSITIWTVIRAVVLCGVATYMGFYNCDNLLARSGDEERWRLCIPLANSEALLLSSLVAFLLGMFTQITFQRWWETRKLLQVVMARASNFAVMTGTYVLGGDDATDRARKTIIRYLNLAHASVYKQATGDEDMSDLINRDVLTMEEWEKLKPLGGRFNVIYMWISEIVRDVARSGHLLYADTMLPNMQVEIGVMRGAVADIFMHLTCQIPYSYVHLLTLITKLHLLFVVLYSSTLIAVGFSKKSIERILMGYLINCANQIIYEGILIIHTELLNPFGTDAQDFPRETYIRDTENSTRAILGQKLYPSPAPEVKNLQDSWTLSSQSVSQPSTTQATSSGDLAFIDRVRLSRNAAAPLQA
mmetsp:Transcript_23814/g.39172  ORF Transcript_23814/g.39172 Transcript_23814/m.39172 type:complete len:447 (+) Transcript_23814:211-1551(+)|eukprot:CAMPEP_0184658584 /NCGR_PEP_ID=MMETSP0308-20130426/26028_1 /TAXON_ID=38269 /ORGANISM="Gloeochaete witrockiana, Strain SAG 46.84" /LENGTH=446 /DNA_ID=CAMNT_0027097695 /DNA_START=175 /DNA_END=1515 /DNA_ORIENTATION=-